MSRYYWIREAREPRQTGHLDASHPWGLPGLSCPTCGVTWAGSASAFPSVDLTSLPERAAFEKAQPEPLDEFARRRELVRPLVPPGAQLLPGVEFGPLEGTASGSFGQFFLQSAWMPLIRREAWERLQSAGLRGLRAFPTRLRFRQKNPPELLELELTAQGNLHPDCFLPEFPTRCAHCDRLGARRPEIMILEAASLPDQCDLFRLADFETTLIGTERFMNTVRRLGLDGAECDALTVR
ncbi:double-CXXCG motif protein [Hyalangium minutum]|uniref:SitI6 family double-CXXCG motif immunity protein n=1 Tax=Hyalangium minutum TaxID=394096 RepID=UPI0005C51607|nr:double-CXXCG motif protein [Hyalangium minutum]